MNIEDRKIVASQAYAIEHYTDVDHLDVIEDAWLAGFETATLKWINAEDEKPSEDEEVLCKRYNADIPEIVNYAVCRYYQGYWYGDLNGGDKIVQWRKIAE